MRAGLLDDNVAVFLCCIVVLGKEAAAIMGLWRQIVGATFDIIVDAADANLFFTVASGITTGDKEQMLLLPMMTILAMAGLFIRYWLELLLLIERLGHITRVRV